MQSTTCMLVYHDSFPHVDYIAHVATFPISTSQGRRGKGLIEEKSADMPPRGYALVFFFWALLTIITPTLIFLSASAKQSHGAIEEAMHDLKVSRRMMGIMENGQFKNTTTTRTTRASTAAPAPAPAPAPTTGNETLL
ncbi:hypothetical protein Cni_G21278 [Canna indica]|uniref:Uncharacterized protein n=1 Tax=Canna indica TaxID=4628 RepID=A0AAQ3QKJ2_9LILI|nr:hypothetical protein Cni_G21278 [Canna indica]